MPFGRPAKLGKLTRAPNVYAKLMDATPILGNLGKLTSATTTLGKLTRATSVIPERLGHAITTAAKRLQTVDNALPAVVKITLKIAQK